MYKFKDDDESVYLSFYAEYIRMGSYNFFGINKDMDEDEKILQVKKVVVKTLIK